jgi:hypothetical protein
MPYTNPWPNESTTPPDSELANLLAKNIRDLELNIRERMDDVFTDASGLWSASGPASPVVPSAKILGNVTGKQAILHWSAFGASAQNADVLFNVVNDIYIQHDPGQGGFTLWAPVTLQPGVIITSVDFLVNRNAAGGGLDLTGKFGFNTFATPPVTTLINTAVTVANGWSIISTPVFAHGLTGGLYFVEVEFPTNSGGQLAGARVNYNALDCRSTL